MYPITSFPEIMLINSCSVLICDVEVIQLQNSTDQFEIEKDSITNYIQTNKIDSIDEFASGLYFKKLTSKDNGSSPVDGNYVKIHFERSYLDGTVHFSTINNNPVSFQLGSNQAVEGLEDGIKRLKEGEKALILPSDIAFGASCQVATCVEE